METNSKTALGIMKILQPRRSRLPAIRAVQGEEGKLTFGTPDMTLTFGFTIGEPGQYDVAKSLDRLAAGLLPVKEPLDNNLIDAVKTAGVGIKITGDEAEKMRAAIEPVKHAISTEDTRYYLNGVFVDTAGGELIVVATDGHRLATNKTGVKIEEVVGFPDNSLIIPAGALKTLAKLGAWREVVLYSLTAVFKGAGWELTTKLIDGTFPAWRNVMPDKKDMKHSCEVTGYKKLLALAAKDGKRDGKRGVRVYDGGGLAFRDEVLEPATSENYVVVNAGYLLQAIGAGMTTLHWQDDAKAVCLLTGAVDSYALMPMRED